MVNLSQFLPRLLPHVLGCPEPVAIQALLDSAIDFCAKSGVVSVTLDPITVIGASATYELETPTSTTVNVVEAVWYDGNKLEAAPYHIARQSLEAVNGNPRWYVGGYVDEVYSITLLPTPKETLRNGLIVRASLRPTRSAAQVHSVLFDRYADGVVQGAIAKLAAIPDQSYTDVPKATAADLQARAIANHARGDVMRGNAQVSLGVKMRAF